MIGLSLNPLRASMVADLADYPWSSHHAYIDSVEQPWVTTDFVLRMFHTERARAIAAYQCFVEERVGIATTSPLAQSNTNDPRVLGDDLFLASIVSDAWTPGPHKTLDEVFAEACYQFAVTKVQLQSSSRQRQLTKARAWVAWQAVSLRIASLASVARILGRDESSLRQSVTVHFRE